MRRKPGNETRRVDLSLRTQLGPGSPPVPAGKELRIRLPLVKPGIVRLEELTSGLAKEATAWKNREDPLLYLERKRGGWRRGRLEGSLAACRPGVGGH